MKNTIKFLTAAFALALSFTTLTLEAQTERAPAPDLKIAIDVTQVNFGIYTLEVVVKNEKDDTTYPFWKVEWYRDGRPFRGTWCVENVKYGTYRVVVRELRKNRWGEARVVLLPPKYLPGRGADM